MSDLDLKTSLTRLRLPQALLSAWSRLLSWARDWMVLEAQARARTCLNRGSRMWE
jgi:hypothetical protein